MFSNLIFKVMSKNSDNTCHVYFEDLELSGGDAERNIPFEYLIPVQPVLHDRVSL
jgi:hypothetical protein